MILFPRNPGPVHFCQVCTRLIRPAFTSLGSWAPCPTLLQRLGQGRETEREPCPEPDCGRRQLLPTPIPLYSSQALTLRKPSSSGETFQIYSFSKSATHTHPPYTHEFKYFSSAVSFKFFNCAQLSVPKMLQRQGRSPPSGALSDESHSLFPGKAPSLKGKRKVPVYRRRQVT